MKFRIILASVLAAVLSCAFASAAQAQRDTVRILAIGNSFSEDAVEQNLHEIGMADGRVLIIGNMYIGGCSLERHVNNLRNNIDDYAYRKIGVDGVKVNRKGTTLEYALADEKWDYVSFQQASPLSGQYESYTEWLPELYNYVKERTAPGTQYIIHQTWAYAKNSTHTGFANYGRDQQRMYESIVDAYNRAAELVGIGIIIPCGTAIQNARTSFIGDNMNRDGYHLNLTYGRFTAACTWYEKLFGGIMDNSYSPEGMPSDYVEVAHAAAHGAVMNPNGVTVVKVAPIGPGESVGESRDTVRLLCIGNSFSEDAVEQYLADMVREGGHVLIIGNMYIGGCTLERHVGCLRENKADYSYRKIGADLVKVKRDSTTLEYALADEPWDYVSLQQNATKSIDFKNYSDWLPELYAYVKERVSPETQFIFHQSWAYRFNPPSKYTAPFDEDQMKMYNCLVDCGNRACELVGISILVPTASAIQSARTTFIGDDINRDEMHVNKLYGRFTLACTWYEKLYGNVLNNRYVPEGLTSDYEKIARLAAYSAVRNPNQVTPIDVAGCSSGNVSPRSETFLEQGWKFHRGEVTEGSENEMIETAQVPEAALTGYDDSAWEDVTVPHDWAIYGPFDEENDIQVVAVTQNFETKATRKTGRTGGLPYVGTGWYRTSFNVPAGKRAELVFDGAMSRARVWVNGVEVCYWPYGYNSFHCDVTDYVREGENLLAVRLENLPNSSRWYPGAGLYRDVHLVLTDGVHIPVWGTKIVTGDVAGISGDGTLAQSAVVDIQTEIDGISGGNVELLTEITDASGAVVASYRTAVGAAEVSEDKVSAEGNADGISADEANSNADGTVADAAQCIISQSIEFSSPKLWSPEEPNLYTAVSKVYEDGILRDEYSTVFGVRTIEFDKERGFLLNGVARKFRGVCNHHDLGPLGAAVNEAALRHQLLMLKDMGCDAIRTSHNMPAPQLVRLCDEIGLMMMVEPFDEWDIAKCENGYHIYFDEWAEKDMVNMLRHYRNDPAVVLWSIGNEVPSQCAPEGSRTAEFLRDICHREDPTRPITCGMDQAVCVLENGFANVIDIPGLNYRTFKYIQAHEILPQSLVLGTETASTVSSRGYYDIPAIKRYNAVDESHQCSSYDLEACSWSNIPDVDFALQDDYDWTLGQFVWTGFDYLGEPSPYDTDAWPNHSSMFGIIDLASIPKDRFWLYRSVWNTQEPTLHVLPHWNWTEGANIPVFVYTSWPEAELFVNGVSCGRQRKYRSGVNGLESPVDIDPVNKSMYEKDIVPTEGGLCGGGVNEPMETRYRLMWYGVPYEPGELKVVAYDNDGNAVDETVVRTAGEPDHIELACSYGVPRLKADGKDLAYVTVRIVDKDGNLCPYDDRLMEFNVTGVGKYRAAANGDPTCLDLFHEPKMHAFNGMLTVIVQSGLKKGTSTLSVSAEGLPTATMKFSHL